MKVGFVNGCFDLFHEGHQSMLLECTQNCDYLIVAVNSDASVKRLKGLTRPIWNWEARAGLINLYLTDNAPGRFAVIRFEGDEGPLLMNIRPEILFKGWDHSALPIFYRKIGWKKLGAHQAFEGPIMHQCKQVPGVSTTSILESQREKAERVIPDAPDRPPGLA